MTRYVIGMGASAIVISGFYYAIYFSSIPTLETMAAEPVVIGVVGPLSGDAVSYGTPIKNAIFLAVKDLTTQGKDISVIYEDGACSGDVAARALEKLIINNNIQAVIGGVCSGETLAMASRAEEEGVVVFSPSASSPALTTAGDFVFRNNPSDAAGGRVLAEVVAKHHTSIAIISENTENAQAFRSSFVERYGEAGGTVPFDESFSQETKDFVALLKPIIKSEARVLVLIPQTEEGLLTLLNALRTLRITLPVYSTNVVNSNTFIEAAGSFGEGIVFVDLPSLIRENPRVSAFLTDYEKFFGLPEEVISERFYMAAAYDAVTILAQAIERMGNEGPLIRNYLYNIPTYDGLLGEYSFDLNGDVVGLSLQPYRINKGKVELYNQVDDTP